ncbi:APC family permease [Lapillicoccus jejuensis]|uniref:Amino acid/polyamine/organocation transporter (APC superfamily) n=1 Tax=Lapillicoccus jejuensis TaxID=402171 RepID=A0A542DWH9_9MICO|nr:APC family permease [Lapillicoccus jejuensis]TQJ07452.1 amino acid/polyamine/organocation transporter (APC superfamily) [Lapillicoccus jejuensis]
MTATAPVATAGESRASKGLKVGALGLLGSIVVGVASTAPAYSLAASLGFVVTTANGDGIVGVKAPLIMVLAFVPMYFIAVAYAELNKAEPDCGTTFTWAARAFGTRVGWMGGWGIIIADVIVMANLAAIAGSYSFTLVGLDSLAADTTWSTVAGVVWIVIMTWICWRGIEVSARLQYVLLGLEVVTLIAFAGFALVKVYAGGAPSGLRPSLDWLSPAGLTGSAFVTAILIAVFIYWGWDSAVAVNEESDDPARTPGRAAIISTVLLLLTYALVSVATIAFAGVGDSGIGLGNADNADDVFAAMGHDVFGGGAVGWIMVHLLAICVLTSSAASTQTTILPTARTALSMAAFKALPERFARIHPRYLTPTDSTLWMGAVSIAFYVGLTLVSDKVLGDTIAAVGLMIAFYYGLTGFACAWFYRRTMWSSPRDIVMQGVFPLLGGLLLLGAFVVASVQYAAPDYGSTTFFGIGGVFVIGIGSLLLGVVLMVVWNALQPDYFRGVTLPRRKDGDLVLVGGGGRPVGTRLPDTVERTVIAPDLSNLPPGATAIDPVTGVEYHRDGPPPRGHDGSRDDER